MIGGAPGSGNASRDGLARAHPHGENGRMARTFEHPRLGLLTRTGFVWEGARPDPRGELRIVVESGWRRPDEEQAELLAGMLVDLDRLDDRARAFASGDWDVERMQLVGVEVARASTAWTKELGRAERPLVGTLQYTFPGDRNVLDVNFLDGEAVGHDYH